MLGRWLEPRSEQAYALLRGAAGLMFCFHGVQKLFGVLAASQPAFGSQLWVGGVIELCAGLCVALGLFAAGSAFLASGTMAVAYTQFHWKLELGTQLLPAINKGELALLYAVLFLFIACKGAGRYSVDAWRQRRATTPSGASSPRS
jgi:putative oxidoreductase